MSSIFGVTLPKQAQAIPLTPKLIAVNAENQTPPEFSTITLFGAGSLNGALTELTQKFTQKFGIPVSTDFAQSGLQRQRLENGEKADIFTSADTSNPLKLYQEGLSGRVIKFASNRLVAIARPGLSLTPDNLLNQLLNPDIKVGITPPVTDPLGDYTQVVFQKADDIQSGSFQQLNAKSILLSGTLPPERNSSGGSIVYYIEDTQQIDVEIVYYTSALLAQQIAPDLQLVELPDNLAVTGDYGLTILNGANDETSKLVRYILSPSGQKILAKYGFGKPSTGSVTSPQGD